MNYETSKKLKKEAFLTGAVVRKIIYEHDSCASFLILLGEVRNFAATVFVLKELL